MKKQTTKSVVKTNFLRLAIAAVLATSFTPSVVKAADDKNKPVVEAEIKYVGDASKGQLVFQVLFDNKKNENFLITIRDGEGFVFYKKNFKGGTFSKKFMMDKAEMDNVDLTFTISTESGEQSQSFKIDTRFTENTVVTKL
jgi:hypothetical protein